MRSLLFLIILISQSFAQTKKPSSQLLVCLGQEEARYHKLKKQGPTFDLNRRVIDEAIQLSLGTDTKNEATQSICQHEWPSLKFLEWSLLHPNDWWTIKSDGAPLAQELIRELNEVSFDIFLEFVQRLQAEAEIPKCLEKAIPELSPLFNIIKHLQEDVEAKDIRPDRAELERLFKSIYHWPDILKGCKKPKKSKKKATSSQNQ
jgi:hypothetical protein